MTPTHHRLRFLLNGRFHDMAYVSWGAAEAPVVVCVHGLTRSGRDFDALARSLAERFRVICPDLPGRGASDWLPDPALYQPLNYVLALAHLLATIEGPADWIGTSLGGICGMLVASMPGQPIRRLVLNDIGPAIPAAALARIGEYVGTAPRFGDLAAAENYLRRIHAPFGALTDADWRHLAVTSTRRHPKGGLTLHYDPAIAEPIRATEPADVDLWAVWEKIAVPVLAIRGETSDLLAPKTLARMAQSGARTHTVAEAGHAPALMDAPTIAVITGFLEKEG
jgi:pimeloyl-ACP methyl ester carboxylesterase